MMSRSYHVAAVIFIWLLCPVVYGDHLFMWSFGNNFVLDEFTECQQLPITVSPLTSNSTYTGVPPYYLMAFEVGGIPTTTMIGSDPHNLSWQVTHKRGASLMLSMSDSNKSTGGITPIIYNVTAGADTSCIPTPPPASSLPTVTPNVTGIIKTCDPWGLLITGGKKPYSIVLSAVNSPVITNASMGPDDDVFTFIDRADPGKPLMASVLDANGQWGVSSNTILPTGSTDVDCVGLVSTSKTSAQIAKEAADRAQTEKQQNAAHKRMVIGIAVGVGAAALVVLALGGWWYKKRRDDRGKGTWDDQDVVARAYELPFVDTHPQMHEGEHSAVPLMSKVSGVSPYTPLGTPNLEVTPIPPIYFDREIRQAIDGQTQSASSGSQYQASSSSKNQLITPESMARHRKALEARGQTSSSAGPSSSSSAYFPPSPHSLHVDTAGPQFTQAALDPDVQPDIIIQHRDGGAGVVQELPPPYVDRTLLKPSTPLATSPQQLSPSSS